MTTITPYHAKFFAHYLTRRLPANNRDKLTASLHDAQVDLTPHQIDAALFAFKSPLSNGAILANGPNTNAGCSSSALPICASNGRRS